MARMHSGGKGQSGSKRPFVDTPPDWSDMDKENIEALVVRYSKEGKSSAEIGTILRINTLSQTSSLLLVRGSLPLYLGMGWSPATQRT